MAFTKLITIPHNMMKYLHRVSEISESTFELFFVLFLVCRVLCVKGILGLKCQRLYFHVFI